MPGYRHYPALEELCECAERSGLQVRLSVSSGARLELWAHLSMRIVERPVATEPIYGDDLEAAALELLQRAA